MANIDIEDPIQRAGAVYFVVGRGTEGGSNPYRLTVVADRWGDVGSVYDNSGYSIGTIQVDLGQRGRWPLGAVSGRALLPGETTYVDGIIGQAAAYAQAHNLPFPTDEDELATLRSDLLTHGNGKDGRSSITFISSEVRSTINAWAGSDDGKQWIHQHIDLPQVQAAADAAMEVVDRSQIAEERQFEVLCILAKAANQHPATFDKLAASLDGGADYATFMQEVDRRKARVPYFDGPKAGALAEQYEDNFQKPGNAVAMEQAHREVASDSFRPSDGSGNPDIQTALSAFSRDVNDPSVLDRGDQGDEVVALQRALIANGQELTDDGDFGRGTERRLTAFQRENQLAPTGFGDRETLKALGIAPMLDERSSASLHSLVESLSAGGRFTDDQIARIATSSQNYLLENQASLGEVTRIQLSNDGSKLLFRNDYSQMREMDMQLAIRGYVPEQPTISAAADPSRERGVEPVRQ
jgi:Putative peptidoglycan binding domain